MIATKTHKMYAWGLQSFKEIVTDHYINCCYTFYNVKVFYYKIEIIDNFVIW